jgi:hypothetical protein
MAEVFVYTTDELLAAESDHKIAIQSYIAHLFINNHTPVPGDTNPATFIEATYTGYSAQAIVTLTSPALTGNIAFMDTPSLNFGNCTAPTTDVIYGYTLQDSGGTSVRIAVLLDNPITPVVGFPVVIQVRLRDRNP